MQPAPMIDVAELSVLDAQQKLAGGELTSRALTQAYLDRIQAIDRQGPTLNSVIEVNAAALQDADRLDAERAAGKLRGPLHGIPVLLKDNIDAVGMVNSAGSLALADHRPQQDAFLVTRLRAAGAVLLGKTNLSEWANCPFHAFDVRLEQPRRTNAQSLRARSQPVRFERRHRCRNRRKPGYGRCRHGNRRQHHLPVRDQWSRRLEADRGVDQPARHHSDLGVAGHCGADGAQRRRCGGAAHRAGGPRTTQTPRAHKPSRTQRRITPRS